MKCRVGRLVDSLLSEWRCSGARGHTFARGHFILEFTGIERNDGGVLKEFRCVHLTKRRECYYKVFWNDRKVAWFQRPWAWAI